LYESIALEYPVVQTVNRFDGVDLPIGSYVLYRGIFAEDVVVGAEDQPDLLVPFVEQEGKLEGREGVYPVRRSMNDSIFNARYVG
jgi:hypothetical protein